MANLTLVTILVLSFVCLSLSGQPHNLIVGRRGYNDLTLYQSTVSKSNWKPWGKVSEDVKFPVKAGGRKVYISEINAFDLDKTGNGGYAYITKGGVGYGNVTVHFTSQTGKGIDFTFIVYGHFV